MEIRQIRYALAVAKERSFTRASNKLNISQSAVSAQVKILEDEVGFPIFWRSTRGVEMTEEGRTFLHEAERMISDLLNLSETARRLRGGGSETLNLGIISGVAQTFIPRMFAEPGVSNEDIKLRFVVGSTRRIISDVQEERLDAGIAIEIEPDRLPAGLSCSRLNTTEMVLTVSPEHPLAKSKSPINIATIASQPIVMNEIEIGYGQIVLSLFADIGTRPNILAVADNVETIKLIVQTGAGIAILPRTSVNREISNRLMKAIALAPERKVAFGFFRRREPLSQQKEVTLDTLRRVLSSNLIEPA